MSLVSGLRVILSGHLPYRVDRAVQRICVAVGRRERVLRRTGLRIRVRRLTCDEDFVETVIGQREYLRHGITIGRTDTVVDVGGNIGTFAILAASLAPQGRVVTIEPDRQNVHRLRQNIALNNLANVLVIEAAVAGAAGRVKLHLACGGGGFHTLRATEFHRQFSGAVCVSALTLNDLFTDYQIEQCDLLKLDCEGAEFDIVATLPEAIAHRIRQIAMEYHTPRTPEGAQRLAALRSRLLTLGFTELAHEPFTQHAGGHLFLTRRARLS